LVLGIVKRERERSSSEQKKIKQPGIIIIKNGPQTACRMPQGACWLSGSSRTDHKKNGQQKIPVLLYLLVL
jgi:hypothetical protein